MKVAILKGFPIAIDVHGVKTRDLVAGTVEEIDDTAVPGLIDEGYVSLKLEDAAPLIQGVAIADGKPRPQLGEPISEPVLGVSDVLVEAPDWSVKDVVKSAGHVASTVEIPADWKTLHHKTRVALAKKLGGAADVNADGADEFIAAEVARRAGE